MKQNKYKNRTRERKRRMDVSAVSESRQAEHSMYTKRTCTQTHNNLQSNSQSVALPEEKPLPANSLRAVNSKGK